MKLTRTVKPKSRVAGGKPVVHAKARPPRRRAVAAIDRNTPAESPSLPPAAQPAYEELLHFFNESPDLLCIAGFDGMFKRLNPAWHPVLGWSREELRARPFLDFVHPDDRPATLAVMEQLDAGAITTSFENRYHCKDGSWKWLQWTASPLPAAKEIYAIARDVTPQKGMEAKILSILDSERERMGRELHDGHCQSLAAISALCTALARKLAHAAASESALASEINGLLGQAIQQVRDLARGLEPASVKANGLTVALADYCSKTATTFGITCTLRHEPHPRKLNAEREFQLYRIVQQAVNNAITHGRAKSIEVILSFQGCQGTLAVHDDGVGIAEKTIAHPGIGLHTMAYRARRTGGSLEVKRRFPRGTSVTCTFRLPSLG